MTFKFMPEQDGVWALRSTTQKYAERPAGIRTYIPPFLIEGKFNSKLIAVGVKVPSAKENWRFGGFIAQDFDFVGTGYTTENKGFFRTEELIVNEITFLRLPVVTTNPYKLRFFPPTWFLTVEIQIWEYTGTVVEDNNNSNYDTRLDAIEQLVNSRFDELNTRLDNADIPTKLSDISLRLERIEQRMGGSGLSTDTTEGKFFSSN